MEERNVTCTRERTRGGIIPYVLFAGAKMETHRDGKLSREFARFCAKKT